MLGAIETIRDMKIYVLQRRRTNKLWQDIIIRPSRKKADREGAPSPSACDKAFVSEGCQKFVLGRAMVGVTKCDLVFLGSHLVATGLPV